MGKGVKKGKEDHLMAESAFLCKFMSIICSSSFLRYSIAIE